MTDQKHAPRRHKATYATDKRNGGYLVRIIGPNASAFAGREVPVTRKDDTEEVEKLTRLIWTGIDTGTDTIKGTGLPCALYAFAPHPREEKAIDF